MIISCSCGNTVWYLNGRTVRESEEGKFIRYYEFNNYSDAEKFYNQVTGHLDVMSDNERED